MDPDIAAFVEGIRAEYPGCFACGTANPTGLHLDPTDLIGGEAEARFTPTKDHVGAGDILHGGLAATVLDEIMVWAGILSHRVLTVTGTMDLRYVRPVSVIDEIVVRGAVDDRRGRRLITRGVLEVGGQPAVTASGLYLVVRDLSRGASSATR